MKQKYSKPKLVKHVIDLGVFGSYNITGTFVPKNENISTDRKLQN